VHSGLRGEAHRDGDGDGQCKVGLSQIGRAGSAMRGAAQSGPYDEWLSLRVRSYGTAAWCLCEGACGAAGAAIHLPASCWP